MAKLNLRDIRELSHEEIERQLEETKEELFNLRFQNATGQLDNYKRIQVLKRDVARIKTILRENEIASARES
jgi:large subunit ribosomal protein L29